MSDRALFVLDVATVLIVGTTVVAVIGIIRLTAHPSVIRARVRRALQHRT